MNFSLKANYNISFKEVKFAIKKYITELKLKNTKSPKSGE